MTDHLHGCLICGAALVYRDEAVGVTCALCGAAGSSPVACQGGHFACDTCHAAGPPELGDGQPRDRSCPHGHR